MLGPGMLGCLRRAFDLLAQHRRRRLDMAGLPPEDPPTYEMIRHADTLGTFQIESQAQLAKLLRLGPRSFYDLVIEVAIVPPDPGQGEMVYPRLRRREGREPVRYPTPELERALGKTLGVSLFQEQAMRVAIVCARFTPTEADQVRRSAAAFEVTFRSAMVARGYRRDSAERIFNQAEGFASYVFPGSHAASFAFIAIKDVSGGASLIVRSAVFARQRRLIPNGGMLACHGRMQREGEVVYVVAG